MWGRDLLKGGLRWITRNGCSINFWTSHWLPAGPICGLIHGPLLPHGYGYRVADMITTNHQWDFTSLSMVLPSHITQFIYAQPLPIPDTPFNLPDDCVWNQHTRYYSVKSAYHYLVSKSSEATGRTLVTWSWIWKLKIPPKIKNFIWKCAPHRIPTKSVLFPYADMRDQVCPRCNEIEMPIHVLRDCHFARQIWSSFPGHLLIADFFKLEFHDW